MTVIPTKAGMTSKSEGHSLAHPGHTVRLSRYVYNPRTVSASSESNGKVKRKRPVQLYLAGDSSLGVPGGFKFYFRRNLERLLPGKPLVNNENRLFMNPSHESIEERNRERRIPITRAVDHPTVDQRIPGRAQLLG